MAQRFRHRQVGILQLHILADDRDPYGAPGLLSTLDRLCPAREVGRGGVEGEVLEDEVVDPLLAEGERHLVDVVDVARGHDRARRKAGEQSDLLANLLRERALGAAHQHVRRNADAAQLVDGVLGGLGLQLAGVADERDQCEVDEHAATPADIDGELADRLQERQRLDVPDGAADLGHHEVDVARLCDQGDALLDLICDVWHYLDGAPQVVAAALAADHSVIDPSGGDVGGAGGVGVGEALVVTEVEVGLGAVLGDKHLPMLVGRHRARVDVDIGVKLLQPHG